MSKIGCTITLLGAALLGRAQLSDQVLVERARDVGRALKVEFEGSNRIFRQNGIATVFGDSMMVMLAEDGRLVGWSGRSRAINRLTTASLVEEQDAVHLAKRYADLLCGENSPTAYVINGASGRIAQCNWEQGKAIVHFADRPFGYRVIGGNSVNVELEADSGDLRFFTASTGYTYREPNILSTLDQAARTAQQALQTAEHLIDADSLRIINNLDELKTHYELLYQRSRPGLSAGIIAYDQPGSPMRLKYEFVVNGHYAFVDAETGDLCGGGIAKTGLPSHASSPMPWVVAAGALVLVMGIGGWLRRRLADSSAGP